MRGSLCPQNALIIILFEVLNVEALRVKSTNTAFFSSSSVKEKKPIPWVLTASIKAWRMISPPLYCACHYSWGKEVSVFKLPEHREMIDAQQASCSGSEMFCSSMLRGLFLLQAHLCTIRQKCSGAVILMAQILTLIMLIPFFFFHSR